MRRSAPKAKASENCNLRNRSTQRKGESNQTILLRSQFQARQCTFLLDNRSACKKEQARKRRFLLEVFRHTAADDLIEELEKKSVLQIMSRKSTHNSNWQSFWASGFIFRAPPEVASLVVRMSLNDDNSVVEVSEVSASAKGRTITLAGSTYPSCSSSVSLSIR